MEVGEYISADHRKRIHVRSIDDGVADIVIYSKRGDRISATHSQVPVAELKKQSGELQRAKTGPGSWVNLSTGKMYHESW